MNIPLVPLILKTGLRYVIMLGAASSVLLLTFAWLKISSKWMLMPPVLAFAIALTYLAHLYFKENNDGGTMTFGQGVIISFWMGLASGTLISLVTYVYSKFINTAYMFYTTEKFMPSEIMFFSDIFSTIFYAVIVGLVVSLITKKDPPATF